MGNAVEAARPTLTAGDKPGGASVLRELDAWELEYAEAPHLLA